MSRRCPISGKGPIVGNNISHAHNKTKRRQLPNLQPKRIFVPELNRFVRLRLTTRALKTITRTGLVQWLRANGKTLKDIGA